MQVARWKRLIWLASQTCPTRNAGSPLALRFLPGNRSINSLNASSSTLREGTHGVSFMSSVAQSEAASSTGTSQSSSTSWVGWKPRWEYIGIFGAGVLGATTTAYLSYQKRHAEEWHDEHEAHLVNWSGTHECSPRHLYHPESLEELEELVATAHRDGRKLRCVGSALSPNGLAFEDEGMVSLALMGEVLGVDPVRRQVRVQAGARVQDVVEQLRPHGLTLQNYASIREQSIGGFTQVSAHGTGAAIPPVDEQVVALKLVTPGVGTLEVTREADLELFDMCRVGLGALGVVAELTLQCVPAHHLLEHTFVTTMREVKRRHAKWLRENQHIRYHYFPYTDAVVVVTNNPVSEGTALPSLQHEASEEERREPLLALLREAAPTEATSAQVEGMSSAALRCRLLELNPLDKPWVARINQAEAEYWRRSEGYRIGWSDQLLGFDCGGQQWVLEVALPTGTLRKPNCTDLKFVEELLRRLEAADVPAPSPIEQRWSAASTSRMSPAFPPPGAAPDTVTTWVGIIMYLPEDDPEARNAVTASFSKYCHLMEEVMEPYNATEHWAKIEIDRFQDLDAVRRRMASRYPAADFNAVRQRLDPKNIMSNRIVDTLFPMEPIPA